MQIVLSRQESEEIRKSAKICRGGGLYKMVRIFSLQFARL